MRYFDNNNTNHLSNEHIMLLYEDRHKCNNFIIDIINEGLRNGCLCIYASLDIDNSNKYIADTVVYLPELLIIKQISKMRI